MGDGAGGGEGIPAADRQAVVGDPHATGAAAKEQYLRVVVQVVDGEDVRVRVALPEGELLRR